MPKVNVYLPDELAEAVKEAGVPVSAVCQRALEQAVRRVTAIRETALGSVDDADMAARWPHLTARTRTALRLAIEHARADRAAAVGTGHLLRGVLAEGGNLALSVLRAMEIDPERLRASLAERPPLETGPDTPAAGDARSPEDSDRPSAAREPGRELTADHFSGPGANALEMAVTEATALGHNYVGCEHLLLGLIAEPDGLAGRVLRSSGAELRLTRRSVAAALAGYVHLRAQTGQPASAPAGDQATMLASAIRQELQPLVRRIERLEERIGAGTGDG